MRPGIKPVSSWILVGLATTEPQRELPQTNNFSLLVLFFFLSFLPFLGLHLWHMKVPRPGVESEPQLPVFATVTTMQDLSHVCNLHHSSWQQQILNPLSEARDQTCNLMVPSQIRFCCTMTGTPPLFFLIPVLFVFFVFLGLHLWHMEVPRLGV